MKNTLLIHIGTGKTGTSALQSFLFKNREMLEEYGWSYPALGDTEADSYFEGKNGAAFVGEDLKPIKDWTKVWKRIEEQLEKSNVIISEESFFNEPYYVLFKEMKKLYDNIKLVVYLRRQDRYVEARYNQIVKGVRAYSKSCTEYFKEIQSHCEYLRRLEILADYVGRENIIVRVYEKQQFMGERKDIISDFFEMLGCKIDYSRCQNIVSMNSSLNSNNFEIKRCLNLLFQNNPMYSELVNVFQDLNNIHERSQISNVEGYFSIEERKAILDRYEEDNMLIAQQYLGRESGELFYDKNVNIPMFSVNMETLYRDIIITMGGYIKYLFECQQKQNRNIQAILQWMLNGKKLVLLGAGGKCDFILNNYSLPVVEIWDNDEKKHGIMFRGYPVTAVPQNIPEDCFIVITPECSDELELQLQKYRCKKGADYILAKEWFYID